MRSRFFHFSNAAGILLALMLLLPAARADDVNKLADDLATRSNLVIEELKVKKAGGELGDAEALEIIRQHLSPIISYDRLTRQALGKHARRLSDDERGQVTDAFRLLLEKTYAGVLAQYSDQQVELVEKEQLENGDIRIRVNVSNQSKSVGIDYTYFAGGGKLGYQIGNITVEGVSLVANYRRQFSQIIGKHGVDGLIKRLQALAKAKGQ